jgi:hypothetical protein
VFRPVVVGWLLALPLIPACQCEEPVQIAGGSVSGVVCNPLTGQPEPGTVLTTTFTDPNTSSEVVREIEAESDGSFTLGLPSGTHTVHVENGDKFAFDFSVDVEASQTTVFKDEGCRELALPPGAGEIIGTICNRHTGEFVNGGTATVILSDGTELTAETGADGSFILSNVPAGIYVVYVRAPGFQKTYQVEVVEGEQVSVEEQARDCEPPDPSTTACIVGDICAPDPTNPTATVGTPLAGALVYVDQTEDGYRFEDETLDDGSFTICGIPLTLNGGRVTVTAEKGSFSHQFEEVALRAANDPAGPVRVTLEDECQPLEPAGERKFLAVRGFYDRIQDVLDRNGIGPVVEVEGNPLEFGDSWTTEAFGDYAAMSEYDVIFVNCGVDQLDFQGDIDPVVKANLRQYVQQGGSVYVSDWAYDLVEKVWPEKVDFYGDDAVADSAEFGAPGSYAAEVMDPGLEQYLGDDAITVDYSFRGSALIRQVATDATVFLRTDMGYEVNGGVDTLEDMPITVGFKDGLNSGTVVFTSFHQETSDGETEELDGPEDEVLKYLVFLLLQ